jgi:hypothetical protein
MYRPRESPANHYINDGAGDAGGISLGSCDGVSWPDPPCHLPDDQDVLKATLNVFEADEQLLDDPEDLTNATGPQNSF